MFPDKQTNAAMNTQIDLVIYVALAPVSAGGAVRSCPQSGLDF